MHFPRGSWTLVKVSRATFQDVLARPDAEMLGKCDYQAEIGEPQRHPVSRDAADAGRHHRHGALRAGADPRSVQRREPDCAQPDNVPKQVPKNQPFRNLAMRPAWFLTNS
jgi:hypothetical protein